MVLYFAAGKTWNIMQRILTVFFLLTSSTISHSKDLITFRISEPLCVLTFLQTAGHNSRHNSVTLREYIYTHLAKEDSMQLVRRVDDFEAINLEYTYNISGYPDQRVKAKNTLDLINMAAVQARDVDDFMQRIIGLLPNEQWMQLQKVMNDAAVVYNKMLGTPYAQEMKAQLAALQQYGTKTDDIFNKLKHFYGSTWSKDIPFTVGIYGIPGKSGNTTATPHSNSLVLGVLTAEKDHDMRACVAIHEICHVLFGEQPMATQLQMDRWFRGSNSMSSAYAYSYFDEALATAGGNAWAYELLSGHMDTTEWYNDAYIDGYAHVIYPLLKNYIESGKVIDSAFVVKAIQAFERKFPNAYKSYASIMNTVNIYTDATDQQQFRSINMVINKYFRISNSSGSYPINDPQALQQVSDASGTQFFIVHREHEANYKALREKFPQLKNIAADQEGVMSFFDDKKRPVIIINVKDISRLDKGLIRMAKAKEIKESDLFLGLE